jgi:hypothetical protein
MFFNLSMFEAPFRTKKIVDPRTKGSTEFKKIKFYIIGTQILYINWVGKLIIVILYETISYLDCCLEFQFSNVQSYRKSSLNRLFVVFRSFNDEADFEAMALAFTNNLRLSASTSEAFKHQVK